MPHNCSILDGYNAWTTDATRNQNIRAAIATPQTPTHYGVTFTPSSYAERACDLSQFPAHVVQACGKHWPKQNKTNKCRHYDKMKTGLATKNVINNGIAANTTPKLILSNGALLKSFRANANHFNGSPMSKRLHGITRDIFESTIVPLCYFSSFRHSILLMF